MRPACPRPLRLGAALIVATGLLSAAEPLDVRWTDTPPVIDGKMDEAVWQQAPVIDRFLVPGPGEARPAREATRARLLWDRDWLYFCAELDDADVSADVKEHDGPMWRNDVFEIFLKPAEKYPGYFEFEVNPFGAVLDAFFPDADSRRDPGQLKKGEFHVEAKVAIRGTLNNAGDRDQGWTVEGRIPWSDFSSAGGRPAPGETWRFTLTRVNGAGRSQELSSVAPLSQPSFHRTEEYLPLRFAGAAGAPRVAWRNTRLIGSPEGPTGYAVSRIWPQFAARSMVTLAPVPGSEWIWYVQQEGGWSGPTRLGRLRAGGDGADAEVLLEPDELVYSIEFHPRYAENGYVYLGANGPRSSQPRMSRVLRYQVRDGRPDPASRTVIIEWASDGHNGCALAFAKDGLLFVTSGDGSSTSDLHQVGQNPLDLRAKILRIDADHPSGRKNYSVPKDNPFVGDARFAPETWAYGLRNPWRLTYDAASDQLWCGENGQDAWESARLVRRGENYGWARYEGSHPFLQNRPLGPTPVTFPTLEFSHAEFRSLTGGIVYRGKTFPELVGAYVFGDFNTGRVWAAKHDGKRLEWAKELVDTPFAVTHVTTDAGGELVLTDYGSAISGREINGGVYRLVRATPTPAGAPAFAGRLSEAGLFADVGRQTPAPGVVPYAVNVPGWHDGATAEHFIALPPGGKIEVRANKGWDAPNDTALVQTLTRGGRRVETRVLLKQGNDWAGYTYVWDAAQRDAVLAAKAGAELELADGRPWRVPSRAECMMCHTREANFALTLQEGQINHGNQLLDWERREMLQADPGAFQRGRFGFGGRGGRGERAQTGQRRAPPSTLLPRLPDAMARYLPVDDKQASLEGRARSYLAVNCAHCHTPNGGGNSVMNFEWGASIERMQALGEKPQHGDFGLADARIIAPGEAGRSVLVPRVAMRGPGQMPPVGTRISDPDGMRLLVEWIQSKKP